MRDFIEACATRIHLLPLDMIGLHQALAHIKRVGECNLEAAQKLTKRYMFQFTDSRYSFGDMPTCCLKSRVKCWGYLNPRP